MNQMKIDVQNGGASFRGVDDVFVPNFVQQSPRGGRGSIGHGRCEAIQREWGIRNALSTVHAEMSTVWPEMGPRRGARVAGILLASGTGDAAASGETPGDVQVQEISPEGLASWSLNVVTPERRRMAGAV